jgi:AcrR family transcriptional regulator
MGRPKRISDAEILRVARAVFREHGHTATTREIAQAAGISEAVLYQRFANKDDLFLAAMTPGAPDVERLLGPVEPPNDAHAYLREVVVRLGEHFADVIPLALQMMTHPSFDPAARAHARPGGPGALRQGLAERLESLARRGRIATPSPAVTARLLIGLAHDWALMVAFASGAAAQHIPELAEMVDIVWNGLRVGGDHGVSP